MATWLELSEILFAAGEEGLQALQKKFRPRRKGSYKTIRPGPFTPMWNQLRIALRSELKPYGSKVRLARIKNTVALDEIAVSENLLPEVRASRHLETPGETHVLAFNDQGNLF